MNSIITEGANLFCNLINRFLILAPMPSPGCAVKISLTGNKPYLEHNSDKVFSEK